MKNEQDYNSIMEQMEEFGVSVTPTIDSDLSETNEEKVKEALESVAHDKITLNLANGAKLVLRTLSLSELSVILDDIPVSSIETAAAKISGDAGELMPDKPQDVKADLRRIEKMIVGVSKAIISPKISSDEIRGYSVKFISFLFRLVSGGIGSTTVADPFPDNTKQRRKSR